jgi:phage-related protein
VSFALWAMKFHLMTSVIPAITSAATAVWGFTAALFANPITWVVVGLAALAAAFYYAWENVEEFRAGLYGVWEVVKNLAAPILAIGRALLFPSLENLKGVVDAVKNVDISKSFTVGYENGVKNFRDEKNAPAKANAFANSFAGMNPQFALAGIGGQNPVGSPSPYSKGTSQFNYSPTIQIQGGASKGDVQAVIIDANKDFERRMKEYEQSRQRKMY